MKKATNDEMPDEINFSKAVRGKYAGRFAVGSNIVMIKPEIFAAFPSEKAVNDALALLMRTEARATRRRPVSRTAESVRSR